MRVLEPHHFPKRRGKRQASLTQRFARLLLALGCGFLLWQVFFGQQVADTPKTQTSNETATTTPDKPPVLKQFTAAEFKQAYSSHIYPNTESLTTPPEITGNEEADTRIREIAEKRGYKLTAIPVASIVKTGEPGLEGDDLMQPNALIAWQQLKTAATKDGIKLKLTSAYRSIDYQRTLFMRRLNTSGVNVGRILEGYADDEIETVLTRAAPPGYSRHHTGYTMDLSCNGVGLDSFKGTSCYKWLSKNNFEQLKKTGWVPSYPEDAEDLGPEPEPWEFIWIGTGATYQ